MLEAKRSKRRDKLQIEVTAAQDRLKGVLTLKNEIGLRMEAIRLGDKLKKVDESLARGVGRAIEQQKKSLELLEKRLKVVQKEKKAIEAATKFQKEMADLIAKVKAGDPALDKLLADALKDPKDPAEITQGRFQTIRSEFIDVAAFGKRDKDSASEKNNVLTETTNRILMEMNRRSMGVFQT